MTHGLAVVGGTTPARLTVSGMVLACATVLVLGLGARGVSADVMTPEKLDFQVHGSMNLYAAGLDSVIEPGGGGGGTLPIGVDLGPGVGRVVTFPSIQGTISPAPGVMNGAEGGQHWSSRTNINATDRLSGIIHEDRNLFLMGVFLPEEWNSPAPEALTFRDSEDYLELSPLLGQTFLIGNGRTSDGLERRFVAPDAATRLYLGFADAWDFQGDVGFFDDNTGELGVSVRVTPIPEPSAVLIWGLAGLGAAIGINRRRARLRERERGMVEG